MILIKEDDKCFKIILKSILLLIACAGVVFFALLLTYSFPREKMKEHVLKNADYYSQNDFLVEGYPSTRLDLYTDATMLSAAICPASENKIADAMLAPRRRLLGNEDDRQLIANYTCEDETQVQYCYYPRYWHGYLTVLKPLLLFFSTEDLHLIYFFVQSCLLLSLTAALIKKNQLPLAVCFGIGVLLLNPMVTALNFQNASIYLILLLITSGILYAMLTVRKAKFTSNWLCRNFSTALVALYPFCHMLASTHAYYHYFLYTVNL